MKSVLISIRPKWCEKIASGEKTIEVRKSAPKETPFKAYIYATKPKKFYKCGAVSTSDELLWLANSKVEMGDGFKFWADGDEYQCLNGRIIGEFICDKVDEYNFHNGLVAFNSMGLPSGFYGSYLIFEDDYESMCLSYDEVKSYGKGKTLYGWHISDLKIYDKPKELSEFKTPPCEKSEKACGNCKWLVKINTSVDYECECYVCSVANGRPITRPPQSWQYVGEVEQ